MQRQQHEATQKQLFKIQDPQAAKRQAQDYGTQQQTMLVDDQQVTATFAAMTPQH
jgi:peptide methionine sulfoxide reductase MsrA